MTNKASVKNASVLHQKLIEIHDEFKTNPQLLKLAIVGKRYQDKQLNFFSRKQEREFLFFVCMEQNKIIINNDDNLEHSLTTENVIVMINSLKKLIVKKTKIWKFVNRFQNGKIERITIIKNEKKHGQEKIFDRWSNLKSVANYKNGLLHGNFTCYNSKRKIISVKSYENDKLLSSK